MPPSFSTARRIPARHTAIQSTRTNATVAVTIATTIALSLTSAGHVLEAVLPDQAEVVALVEDLAVDLGVLLTEAADLAVLLRHQLLVQRGDLDEQVVLDLVEVEEACELALAGVGKGDGVALRAPRGGPGGRCHAPPATLRRPPLACFASVPSRSVHTLSTAMAKTP